MFEDATEWDDWKKVGDDVLHIELRKWAHIGVVLPLSANSLGKMANGLCDTLLTCTLRAWDFACTPMVLFPCMNTLMWQHPITARQLKEVQTFGE